MPTQAATRDPLSAGRLTRLPVTQVMQAAVATVHVATPLPIALAMMARLGIRHLAAVNSDGTCAGVLCASTATAAWAAFPGQLMRQTVSSALGTARPIIGRNAVVGQVAQLMRANGTTAVAVADQHGLPAGIVTVTDLVALLARDTEDPEWS
jgi:CBS domain-containing protein